jgi:hypothetical protein
MNAARAALASHRLHTAGGLLRRRSEGS